jgi:hypothetical protein
MPTPKPTLDPLLAQQLRKVPDTEEMEAVFTLRAPAKASSLTPAATRAMIEQLLKRAEKATGARASRLTVFENIQSFALSAPAALIKALTGFKEIASAAANQQEQDLMIRPVERREVKLPK